MTGRIITWQPPALLEFSWDTGDASATLVRCELTREGDGTLLVFRHDGIATPWMGRSFTLSQDLHTPDLSTGTPAMDPRR